MKKISKYFFVGITLFFTLLTVGIAFITYRYDQSPEDSSAIYGGRLNEDGYPFAGYLIAYESTNKASVCGSVYLSSNVAVTAAHCIKDDASIFLGFDKYKFNPNSNILASDAVPKDGWDGKDNRNDLAVVVSSDNEFIQSEYASIGEPSIGCNYEVLGYGSTEIDDELPTGTRLRKSALLCVERIDNNLLYLKGQGGGICFGDSGSPVFEKGTNKLVAIISGIISNRTSTDYCHIDNKAVAVRVDNNINFISEYLNSDQNPTLAKCGDPCQNSQCAEGLVCSNNLCVSETGDSCLAEANQFCSSLSNLTCSEGSSCVSNRCIVKTVDEDSFNSGLFANFNVSNLINSGNQTSLYFMLGSFSVVVALGWLYLIKLYREPAGK